MGGKKREEEPKKGAPEYMLTFGDMMSLLLCFFVLLVSMSTMEVEKFKQAAASMRGALSVLPYQESVVPSPVQSTPRPSKGSERRGKKSRAIAKLEKVIRESKMQNVIKVSETKEGIHITIGDPALFDSGQDAIKPEILPVLNQIVEVVSTGNEVVRVEGHTDNVPIHNAQFEDNWELSIARAISVIRYFRTQQNMDPERLRPVGCGEFHPVGSNDTSDGRALNRRVEIYIDMVE